jgi:DNA-binding NtrC family response regulator
MSKFLQGLRGLFGGGEEPAPDVTTQPDGEKTTILVIDDDRSLLDALRVLLEQAGFNVMASNTGVKGLNILRYAPGQVKVVLLDFAMPEFNGAQTLHYIRQLCPNAKVIGVTGVSLESLPADYRDGVDDIVHKPFASAQLVEHIKTMLALQQSGVPNKS